jgi:hypothetical protein
MLIMSPHIAESDESKIIEAACALYKDATDFRLNRVGDQLEDGNTYMVDFKSKETGKAYSCFYAYVDSSGCQILEDGKETFGVMQNLLEKQRNFMQKLMSTGSPESVRPETGFLILSMYVYVAFLGIISTALCHCLENGKAIQPYSS